jgi:hypothetical protein
VHLSAACPIARELFPRPGNADGLGRIKGTDAEWRAGPPLAVEAVTGDNQFCLFRERECESAASAPGIGHWKTLRFLTWDQVENSNRDGDYFLRSSSFGSRHRSAYPGNLEFGVFTEVEPL